LVAALSIRRRDGRQSDQRTAHESCVLFHLPLQTYLVCGGRIAGGAGGVPVRLERRIRDARASGLGTIGPGVIDGYSRRHEPAGRRGAGRGRIDTAAGTVPVASAVWRLRPALALIAGAVHHRAGRTVARRAGGHARPMARQARRPPQRRHAPAASRRRCATAPALVRRAACLTPCCPHAASRAALAAWLPSTTYRWNCGAAKCTQ